jgi:aminopeptidase N
VAFSVGGGPPTRLLLNEESTEAAAGRCGEAVDVNPAGVGYYRVQYDDIARRALVPGFAALPPAGRVNLLADSWALVGAGRLTPAEYFALAEAALGDDARAVCQTLIRAFNRLDHLERLRPQRAALQAYARRMLRPAFERLGWGAAPGEPSDRNMLRAELIWALGDFGDADILAEARRRFAAYAANPATLDPELRSAVLHLAGRTADHAIWDTLHGLARRATIAEERSRLYFSLASALDPALAQAALDLALGDEVPSNLASNIIYWVAGSGEHPEMAWDFVQAHFDALAQRLGPSFRDYFASNLLANFTDRKYVAELAHFAPAQSNAGARISAARTEESILIDADFTVQILPEFEAWLASR